LRAAVFKGRHGGGRSTGDDVEGLKRFGKWSKYSGEGAKYLKWPLALPFSMVRRKRG